MKTLISGKSQKIQKLRSQSKKASEMVIIVSTNNEEIDELVKTNESRPQ